MRVYMQLQKELEKKNISKNAVIRKTGIDRSTFYQIMSGKRMATSDQLIRILDSIGVDSGERFELLSEYEREKADEKAYRSRTNVRNFINQLAAGPDLSEEKESSCPEQIRSAIQEAAVSGNGLLQIFLPATLMIRTGMYAEMMRAAKNSRLVVEYLSAFSDEEDDDAIIFENIAECLHCYREENLEIRMYHLGGVLIPSSGVPFPYYIITENHLLLISADADEVIDVSDTEQRTYYCRFFGEQLEKAELLIAFNRNEKEMLERLRGEYAAAVQSGQKIYLITLQPCAMLTVTLDQLMMYWNDERIAGYWKLMNAMNAHEFTSPSGITKFLKSQMIVETGLNIPIRKEDMHLLREDIDKRLGKSLFLLNDDNIHMSEYWEMMIIDKEKVLFAPFYEGRFLISVSYDRIVEALADWCESRMQVANVDVMQNSKQ